MYENGAAVKRKHNKGGDLVFCTNCGSSISERDRFCPRCGARNNYYNPEEQAAFTNEAVRTEPMQREEIFDEGAAADDRTVPQEPTVIQPERVLPPLDQTEQASAAAESLPEAGNILIKPLEEEPLKSKKPVREPGTGTKVASVFLSILAFVLTVVFVISLFLKSSLSQKALETSIQKIDYANVELGELLTDSNLSIEVREEDTTVDIIYEALTEQGQVDISRRDVEKLLEETEFKDYLSEKLSSYARYAVTGAEPDEITPREIVRLIEDNMEEIEEITDLKINSSDLYELEQYLEEDGLLESISLEKIDETLEENKVSQLRTFLSDPILLTAVLVSLGLFIGTAVLLAYLHRRVRVLLGYIGIPLLAGGLVSTGAFILISLLKKKLLAEIEEIYKIIKPVLNSILSRGIIIGAITAGLGLLMVAGLIIIKKVQKSEKVLIKTAE